MKDTKCILPFVHLYSEPRGEVKPCCIAAGFKPNPLNLKKMTYEEAFNSPQMKQLRKDMLEGKRNSVCNVCYKQEDMNGHSPRLDFNQNGLWEMPEVNEDYSVESQFQHIDIRFSNLCNFKCRMCTHEFSSHWFEDMDKEFPGYTKDHPKVLKISDTAVDDLIPHLSKIKSIYFAGGEPLIMPEHFKLLNWLYENVQIDEYTKKRKLSIHYNTNLSVIKYDEKSLIDLWKGFNRVYLSISCDGIGEVGEYQRVGFKHHTFIKNMNTIQKYFNPVSDKTGLGYHYNFQYTTTRWNILHIFDFIDFMKDNNFINFEDEIDFTYAWTPQHASINNLSKKEKEDITEYLKNNLHRVDKEKTINEINYIVNFLNSNSDKVLI